MPFYPSNNSNTTANQNSTQLPQTLSTNSFKTGIAVAANTLAAKANDGKVYPVVEAGKPGSTLLPMTLVTDITNGLQSPPTLFATPIQGRIAVVKLLNGNFAIIYADSIAPYTVRVKTHDPHGVPVVFAAVGPSSSAGGGGLPLVCAALLSNGNFVLVYNSAGRPVFAIYDQGGVQVLGPTSIDAVSTVYALSVAALSSGGFAVCYNVLGPNEVPTYAVFSNAGAVVRAATLLRAAPASNATSVASSICALAGGGFVCAYSINIGGNHTNYCKIFNNLGVAQGSEIIVRAGAAVGSGVVVSPCSGGGFVLLETDGVRLNFFTAAGASAGVTIVANVGAVLNNSTIGTHQNADGGLLVWPNGTTIKAMLFNSAGGTSVIDTVTSTASPTNQVVALLDFFGNVVIGYSDNSAKLAVKTYTNTLAPISSNVFSAVSADVAASALVGCGTYLTSPLNPLAITFMLAMPSISGNAMFAIINAFVSARVTIGLFTASAAAGAYAPVQYSGVGTLAVAFDNIIAADYRASTPIGIKLAVVGNSVVLGGVQ